MSGCQRPCDRVIMWWQKKKKVNQFIEMNCSNEPILWKFCQNFLTILNVPIRVEISTDEWMHTDSSFLQTLFHQPYLSVYFALHLQFICSFIYLNAHFCQTPHYWRLTLSWQNEHRLSLSCTCSLRYLSICMDELRYCHLFACVESD